MPSFLLIVVVVLCFGSWEKAGGLGCCGREGGLYGVVRLN